MKILSMADAVILILALVLVGPGASGTAEAEPFLGEIRWVSFNFAPHGWTFCNGQLLSIAQNQALFSLLGTTFGGNGTTTFALPDMQGRGPIHVSNTHALGAKGGEEAHVLTVFEIPLHSHSWTGTDPREGDNVSPLNRAPAKTSSGLPAYSNAPTAVMAPVALSGGGAGQPHENMKPFITMTCIIALQGIYPSR